ncbi:amino acid ABC transporter permease [Propionimicrobium sp. PCR01-08-3]|uniref:amino acid ABC transporter permease n=1 Tax=Propionimicrobium sp. PCR01-08-3 TaxID=3052086 RepID=UPI00255C7123|nr:amino acid ABC transporter permease [Propionimicrobium sp. PCR01-08-3]WIY81867.1 amino acid ABC transporter permease [Propionimicrobium sp. PCR01-08-3]
MSAESASVLYDAPGPRTRALSRVFSVVAAVGIAALLSWLIWALGQPRTTVNGAQLTGVWSPERWDIFADGEVWEGLLIRGLLKGTLRAAGLAALLAILLGIALCFGRTAPQRWIRIPSTVVLEFFRGMPVLLMMLFILLALGTGGYWAVVLALAIYNGAIIGEALRAGLQALPAGQREAGLSLGLSRFATRIFIEFPQAFRQMLPIIVAQLVVLLKDTSLAYVVAYPEILRISNQLKDYYGSTQYSFSIFIVVLLIYLAVNISLSALARWIAHRSGPKAGTMTEDPVQALSGLNASGAATHRP